MILFNFLNFLPELLFYLSKYFIEILAYISIIKVKINYLLKIVSN